MRVKTAFGEMIRDDIYTIDQLWEAACQLLEPPETVMTRPKIRLFHRVNYLSYAFHIYWIEDGEQWDCASPPESIYETAEAAFVAALYRLPTLIAEREQAAA